MFENTKGRRKTKNRKNNGEINKGGESIYQ